MTTVVLNGRTKNGPKTVAVSVPGTEVQVGRLVAGAAIDDPVDRLAGGPVDVHPSGERLPGRGRGRWRRR